MTKKESTTEEKIRRYHYEEVMLILFILSSDLSKYSDDDLVCFTENIEGRIDLLFTVDFLAELGSYLVISTDTRESFITLRDSVIKLYSANWHKKLREKSEEMDRIKQLASHILKTLKVTYTEPKDYINNHLNIDWT